MTSGKDLRSKNVQKLILPLNRIRGVGPKRAALMALKGLNTVLDLFYSVPIRYEDRSKISPVRGVENGSSCLVKGTVIEGKEEKFYPSRKRIYRITLHDADGEILELIWFRYIKQHLASFSRTGLEITVFGTMKISRGKRQMFHPDITVQRHGKMTVQGFIPVYSSVKGVSQKVFRTLMETSIEHYLKDIIDPVPVKILNRLQLPDLRSSIKGVHMPPKDSSIEMLNKFGTPFHRRLIFDRFFSLMLVMAFVKGIKSRVLKPRYNIPGTLEEDIKGFFRFRLTSDQTQAVIEILDDLKSGHPMNRMLMGDVGTGKTAVAAIAAHVTVLNDRQTALMAPTQILAEQHMEYFLTLPEKMGLRPVLVKGDMKKSEREKVYRKIRDREYNLIIGTQSLIQEDLVFSDLGLAIIDEQHRFGVRQRALMDKKGDSPHVLVMTATPIPRSLAIAVYGDMDISIIRERPCGNRPVNTCLIDVKQKKWAFERLKECISSGRQAFVICPVIEETEETDLKGAVKMHERLKKILSPPYKIAIVHGRMAPFERECVMSGFYKGVIDILVATTVVEVGVHVPNATVMVIERPDRFGLAQLHQLRGRVGRGQDEGICMLILPEDIPEKTEARLKVFADTNDGFEIAQRDLEFRGHGELAGLRQAGMGEIEPSEIITHQELLVEAKRCAQDMVQADPDLSHDDHRHLKAMIESISELYHNV